MKNEQVKQITSTAIAQLIAGLNEGRGETLTRRGRGNCYRVSGFRTSAGNLATEFKPYFQDNDPREVETLIETGWFERLDVIYTVAHFLGVQADDIV